MIAVIFELTPKLRHREEYFQLAASLKQSLASVDGFISIERFQSLADQDRYLSLSFWRDETAVQIWREQLCHRSAQQQGRDYIFADYRLRVANVLRDYSLENRQQVPARSPDNR
ncbi:MAG: antibiotic biosynthesis monooxygenase family protein 1 [Osedax symbiont Rs2]|nr:MAG: antibiotic biosynthesis monooxygenase family protein 1 [Osedax symbiont Rs2]